MPQQFLHGVNVGASLQQTLFKHMLAVLNTAARVHVQTLRWKQPKPAPALPHLWVLHFQCVGRLRTRLPCLPVFFSNVASVQQLMTQGIEQTARQYDHSVFVALGLAHNDDLTVKVHIKTN